MAEPTVTETVDIDTLTSFFGSAIEDMSPSTAGYYAKAVRNFSRSLHTHSPAVIDEAFLGRWAVEMHMQRLAPATITLFFNAISALYSRAAKAGVAPATTAFAAIKPRLRYALGRPSVTADSFGRMVSLLTRPHTLTADQRLGADLLLTALTCGPMPLTQVARLTRATLADPLPPTLAEIIERNADPRRKYIFALRQSALTPAQLGRAITAAVAPLLRHASLEADTIADAQDAADSLWAYAALSAGLSPEVVATHLGHVPGALPILGLVDSTATSPLAEDDILQVGALFASAPCRWYALRMRRGVSFDELSARISTLPSPLTARLFYPLERIARRLEGRLVYTEQPILAGIVFINARSADILPITAAAADLAWCYTVSGRPGSPYAVISDHSLHRFQQAIGQFTPDYPAPSAATPSVGDDVAISGGLFAGLRARLEKIETLSGQPLLQLLHLSDNNIRWTLTLDPRLTHPA